MASTDKLKKPKEMHCRMCDASLDFTTRIKISAYKHVRDKQCHGSRIEQISYLSVCTDCYQKHWSGLFN